MTIRDLLKDAYKEGMTVEDIETALEEIAFPEDLSAEVSRLKNALSKSNGEAAEYKRQLKDRMSEDEIKAKEAADKQEELQKNYDALLRKVTLSEHTAKLLELGYDSALASETAEAMVSGDTDKVFANQKKYLEALEKRVRSDILKGTPKPDGGDGKVTVTKEQLRSMTAQERHDFYVNHPEQYKELYGGNE